MATLAEFQPHRSKHDGLAARAVSLRNHTVTSSRVWILYAALTTLAILVYYLLPRGGVAQAVLLFTVNATAAAAALRAAWRTSGSTRVVWAALGVAMLFATLANGPYYAYPLITGQPVPFPCPVDVLWLLTYPCYVIALLALGKQRRSGEGRGDLLDAALLTLGGGTLMWLFVIAPIVHAPAESLLAHIVSVAYPLMDLMVFAVLVRLVFSGLHRSGASRLLLGSFVALLAADLVYALELLNGTYAFGGPTDGLWMASYALIGIAATHQTARKFPRTPSPAWASVNKARLTFLCVSVLTGPLLLILDGDQVGVLAAVSALSFLLVMARLTGLNWRLASVSVALEKEATTDGLTGLLNRSAFNRAVTLALSSDHEQVGLLLVDLDDFKHVNDLAGHSAGDAVLLEVAQRMRSMGRATDVMARLGGDEFAVLIRGRTNAERFGERLIEVLRPRFLCDGRSFTIGASVGYVEASAGIEPERLIQAADIAMYAAKALGKNRLVTFKESMYTEIVGQSDFAQELENALARNEMHLEYQPIVRLEDGEIVGYEALARWTHPRFGDVSPVRFIPAAEESGAIAPIGHWVLDTALRDLTRIDALHDASLTINVNVSAVQLLDETFADYVAGALDSAGVDPRRLVLELTEGAIVDDTGVAFNQLDRLRTLGTRISVDDFGTGYSSLAYLQRLPVEELKIDRVFVNGIDNGSAEGSVARAIVRMCDELGLRCIAEGVERAEQIAPLRAAGCMLAQGFHFARPMPIDRVLGLLRVELPPRTRDSAVKERASAA